MISKCPNIKLLLTCEIQLDQSLILQISSVASKWWVEKKFKVTKYTIIIKMAGLGTDDLIGGR